MALALAFVCGSALVAESQSAAARGKLANVNGTELYYQECGTDTDAVVLLHDGVANSAVWDDVWPTFCQNFHTLRYDRRGYGHSPENKKAYFEADDLAALLTDRKIKHVALVGASHGGQVAMEFAMRYRQSVSDLVVVAPGVTGFQYSEYYLMKEFTDQQTKEPDKLREQIVQDKFLIAPGNDAARKKLRAILTAAPQDMTHNDMPLYEKPIFPYVGELQVPTLILIGSADISDNQAVTGALLVTIPGSFRDVISDAAHLVYLEKPQEFFNEVNSFLNLHGFQKVQ